MAGNWEPRSGCILGERVAISVPGLKLVVELQTKFQFGDTATANRGVYKDAIAFV